MSANLDADYALIAHWIRPERVYPGDPEAHLVDPPLPVWALAGHWNETGQDIDKTAGAWEVPRDAVEAALTYYQLHRDVIDARLAQGVEFALDPALVPKTAFQAYQRPLTPEEEAWVRDVAKEQGALGFS